MAFCSACGNEIKEKVQFCQNCGATQSENNDGSKEWIIALLLCFFLVCLGVHRFIYRTYSNWHSSIINIRQMWDLGIYRFYYYSPRKF